MTRARRLHLAAFGVLACLLLAPRATLAQMGNSTLSGQVTDAQGAGVPGATVTVTNTGTSALRTTPTGDDGGYRFVALPPGTYELKVEMDELPHRDSARSPTAGRLALEARRVAGGRLARRERAGARRNQAMNTSDASLGNVISGQQIRALPLEAATSSACSALQPGVVYIPQSERRARPRIRATAR